jgi:hypothetical protein
LNAALLVLTPIINFLLAHKQTVIDFATAFGVLALAMKWDDITAAFTNNMTTVMSKIGDAKGAVSDLFGKINAGTVMGAIDTAGAMADLILVQQAINAIQGAISAMNQYNTSVTNQRQIMDEMNAKAQYEYSMGDKAKGDQYAKIAQQTAVGLASTNLNGVNQWMVGHALGTNFAPGGLSLVGENGPEFVDLPRGSKVIPNRQTQQMLGQSKGVTIGTVNINNQMDENKFLNHLGWRLALA